MSDHEHDPDQTRLPAQDEKTAQLDGPLSRISTAAAELAAAVNSVPKLPPIPIPRLTAPTSHAADLGSDDVNPRHTVVSVRTIPILGEPPEVHNYRDDQGLTWQTYGEEHNFATDRFLEVLNSDNEPVASYPPGAWLHVRYVSYLQPGELTVPESWQS